MSVGRAGIGESMSAAYASARCWLTRGDSRVLARRERSWEYGDKKESEIGGEVNYRMLTNCQSPPRALTCPPLLW